MPPQSLLPPPSHIQRQLREALSGRFPPNPPAPLGPNALAGGPRLSPPIDGGTGSFGSVNAAVVLILAVLMCFAVCALAVHTAVRCALAVLGRLRSEAEQPCGSDRVSRAGVGKGEALAALPVLVYFWGLGVPRAAPECAICLTEFEPGERIRVLPECGHAFHVRCIDRWLLAQASCPTCRHSLHPHVVV